MIKFKWWMWIPILGILLFFTITKSGILGNLFALLLGVSIMFVKDSIIKSAEKN